MLLSNFLEFNSFFISKSIKITNSKLTKTISDFSCFHISDINDLNQNPTIYPNFRESSVAIITQCTNDKNISEKFFFICFKNTIIFIQFESLSILQQLFSSNVNIKIFYLLDSEELFRHYIKINGEKNECDQSFFDEIHNFGMHLIMLKAQNTSIKNIWLFIRQCIAGYLIKQGYEKLNHKYELDSQSINNSKETEFNENDFIDLRVVGVGSSFYVKLLYHIEKEELFAMKVPITNESETPKLIGREVNNYRRFNDIHLPKFYGTIKNLKYPVFEFINGQTLLKIKQMKLNETEKIKIISDLIMTIYYFHKNHFIYRDLKPDNIMIDKNKKVFIIDFDRLIGYSDSGSEMIHTQDFSTVFVAPEVNSSIISYKNDIYSLGQMIYYIMNEENLDMQKIRNVGSFENNLVINQIYKICTNYRIELRPTILDLIFLFCLFFKSQFLINSVPIDSELNIIYNLIYEYNYNAKDIKKIIHYYTLASDLNHPESQYNLGAIYGRGEYVNQDMNKAIHYFILAANQNHLEAQFNLGIIYKRGEYVARDINKAIHYYSLAANQNHPEAQYNLGVLFASGEYIARDIKKAIHYYSLAANQNHVDALYSLGVIYSNGKYIKVDMQKAIHYFLLAAEQNHTYSQYLIGFFYEKGQYLTCDINKAIHYYSLAANQNYTDALYRLGVIYNSDNRVTQNINKSIHYLSLAAKQNHSDALFRIGIIYALGKYVEQDISKAIRYFSLASNQNHSNAQYALGIIYYSDKRITLDVSKAIHYLSLAANQNHVKAQYTLGIIYCNGIYVKRDIDKAIHYLSLASNQNHQEAQFHLGVIYEKYTNGLQNIYKAIHYYSLAADHNYANAQYNLGCIYYSGTHITRDISKAIRYFLLAADQNNRDAQYNLGVIYLTGVYITQDINKAIYYFDLAANKNDADAQYNLGKIFEEGEFITRDINKAIHYYTLAANQNHKMAQYNLGVIYYLGNYIPRCINKAIHYFSLAANNNSPDADSQNIMGYYYLTGEYIAQDINKAIHYFTLAADQNNLHAQLNLGIIYLSNEYFKKDINKAIYYFTLAANQNCLEAQYNLGVFYHSGEYIDKDIDKSIYYFTLASKNDRLPEAQYSLGFLYLELYTETFSDEQNLEKAIYYLTLASKNRCKLAYFPLGYIYHGNIFVDCDIKEAIHFYKEASSLNDQYAKNNLGIIYKNGFGNEIPKNIERAIIYFEEAIRQKKDKLSMYNLSHIFLYENKTENKVNEAIEYLIESSEQDFSPSMELLCIALILKYGFNLNIIIDELRKMPNLSKTLYQSIIEQIQIQGLTNKSIFEESYNEYRKIDFLYTILHEIIISEDLNLKIKLKPKVPLRKDISQLFYEGFGIKI